MRGPTDPPQSPLARPLARLSTGTRLFLIMTAALLPLGLIALFASLQSANAKRLQREADTRVIARSEARQIDLMVLRGANLIQADLALNAAAKWANCDSSIDDDRRLMHPGARFALYDPRGALRCATPGMTVRDIHRPRARIGIEVELIDETEGLRFAVASADGSYGVGELPTALLRQIMPEGRSSRGIVLSQGATRVHLFVPSHSYPLGEHLTVSTPVSGGQLDLALTVVISPIGATEILLVLLPLMMWLAAAIIGWLVVNQLLLRPLAQLQRSVADYGPGQAYVAPLGITPSREIRALGEAFRATAAQLAEREQALEHGLSSQVRLTREVHHRVKNNLQVVASLINLHARGTAGEVAAAYASIQRRVDALAIVHRNHFAELEDNRGIAVRTLVSELAANLRASAPPAAHDLSILLDMTPGFISQDVAVPVAFLITELVELVMQCDPAGRITIALTPDAEGKRAKLAIASPSLVAESCSTHSTYEQFGRVITGLSRQLRAPLEHDPAAGRYAIEIPLMLIAEEQPKN